MKKNTYIHLIATLVFMCISIPSFAENNPSDLEQKLQKEKNRLDSINQELSQKKQTIKNTQKKEKSILSQLNETEMELSKKKDEVRKLNHSMDRLQNKLRKNTLAIQNLTLKMEDQREYLSKRIVALYKYTKSGGLLRVLSQSSYDHIIKATRLMGIIVQSDYKAINDFNQNISSLSTYQETLKEGNVELKSQLDQVEAKEKEIKQKQNEKVALLKSIRSEKSLQLSAVKELEASSRNLLELIKRLEREVTAKDKLTPLPGIKGFALLKGKLPFPVQGKIISYFGKSLNEELHTTIFQKGIEIAAPIGAEIRAIHPGRVLYADWLKGYGKIIIIDHGEGYYTLCAHTSELFKKVGDEVKGGESVALVGDTNSLKGSCLYFEIRYHGNPQNPLEWLAKNE